MNLLEEIEKIKSEGYGEANDQARVCQDIILYGISKGRLKLADPKNGRSQKEIDCLACSVSSDAFFECFLILNR